MLTRFELRAREQNLLAEQKARLERERRQKEKERILEERQRQREAEREEEQRLKRLAEQQAAEQAIKQREEQTEWNRGVYLECTLQALEADDSIPAAKGIKRSKDKITLPASVGAALLDQDAARNGAMLFELHSRLTGATTHAGVLEFTAAEGTILLPKKVRDCLFGNGGAAVGLIDVKYKRLQQGTFARFQPLTRGFHEQVQDVRGVLESCLMQYSCLSVGDTLSVDHDGKQHTLRVMDLQPDSAVSVIDTDVEAEVVASVETEQLIRAWEAEQAANAARLAAVKAEREAQEAALRAAAEEAVRQKEEAERQAAAEATQAAQRQAAMQAARLAALPPEPEPNQPEQPVMLCAFKLPDGVRIQRRFLPTTPVSGLLQFVDAHWLPEMHGDYNLLTQFPRRTIARPTHVHQGSEGFPVSEEVATLQSLGLGSQELFLIQPLAPLQQ